MLEEAAFAKNGPGVTVKELIEQAYSDHIELPTEAKFEVVAERDDTVQENIDVQQEFEKICKKFYSLLLLR